MSANLALIPAGALWQPIVFIGLQRPAPALIHFGGRTKTGTVIFGNYRDKLPLRCV
jgi:hypothetical protein